MDTFRHLERHQVRILMFRTAHACTPEPLSWDRLALPESVHYRIFFPSREDLYECISPSSLPHGEPFGPRMFRFHSSPFRVWRLSSSAPEGSEPLGYHPTRNSDTFALSITLIPEGRRQQRITHTSSYGVQCRPCEAPQDHIIRAPLSEISVQPLLRLPNQSLASSSPITLLALWPTAKA